MFNATDDHTGFEATSRAQASQLDRRIVLVATIVMAELWALTAAIEAWAEGSSLDGILMFQFIGFVLAIGFWKAPLVHRAPQQFQTEPAPGRGALAQESAAG